eukprot:scaffold378_cov270-Chaetoceros_neogracile.AAC.48
MRASNSKSARRSTSNTTRHCEGGGTGMNMIIVTTLVAVILMWFGNYNAMQSIDYLSRPNQDVFQNANRQEITIEESNIRQQSSAAKSNAGESQFIFMAVEEFNTADHKDVIKEPPMHTRIIEHLSSASQEPKSPYAYAWVIGGIHEDRPAYKGFLWTILISVNTLVKIGSTADFWVYIRLSPDSKLDDLAPEDRRLMEALDIHIVVLDKPQVESFAQLVYDKFLTINMTDYKRVMFLDGDMIPMTNLDYYFHLSDPDSTDAPTELKSNFIMATKAEPCNTGMFMVAPSKEAFDDYIGILRKQIELAKTLPYPHFHKRQGWGHNFKKAGDNWRALQTKESRWTWHASHSDQGLMYQFAKYTRQDVSIAIGDVVENWTAGDEDMPILESSILGILSKYQGDLLRYQYSCNKPEEESKEPEKSWRCTPPYDSTAHFFGNRKPWQNKFNPKSDYTEWSYRRMAALSLWHKELEELNTRLDMGLDLNNWNEKYEDQLKDVPLGVMAMPGNQIDALKLALLNSLK